jgi:hypothetical protein
VVADCHATARTLLLSAQVRFGIGERDYALHVYFHSSGDPLSRDIDYSPTDNDQIERAIAAARRLLTPHNLVIQMLLSRLQAARYRKPGLMLLIQRVVLRSARAHTTLRQVPRTLRISRS